MEQLSGTDTSMLSMETPTTPNHVAAIMIFDPSSAPQGRVTLKGILAHVERRLHLARSFRRRLAFVPLGLDRPYWIEDGDFDLEFHVRHIGLPKPGDWRQFCILAARLHSRPIDLTRPPWELYVIEGLDGVEGAPPGAFAAILKMHHAAVDGMAGAEMMTALLDATPDGQPPVPATAWQPDGEPSPLSLLRRAAVNNVARPVQLAAFVGTSIPGGARRVPGGLKRLPGTLRRPSFDLPAIPARAPGTRFNGPVTPHRVVEGRLVPLDEMKRIKNAVPGATVNDAALAVVGGAMRKYLAKHDELPRRSLVALVPISVRTGDQSGEGGNRISAMLVALRTDLADPAERLAAIQEETRRSKQRASAVSAKTLAEISEVLPGRLIGMGTRTTARLAIKLGLNLGINTTVTNVPGSAKPFFFCGARLIANHGMGPLVDGMGIIHLVGSMSGDFCIDVTACREMMPDPGFYAECLGDAFAELSRSTGGEAVRPVAVHAASTKSLAKAR
jgi:WS/DGAT/MGAT family acyltransferase